MMKMMKINCIILLQCVKESHLTVLNVRSLTSCVHISVKIISCAIAADKRSKTTASQLTIEILKKNVKKETI